MASSSARRSREVVTAINNLLQLEEGDQASLLDVIEDYFTMPGTSTSGHSDSDSDSESDSEADYREGR